MNAPRRGFTMIELMIVLVVAGVLATIAAPSMRDLVVRVRLKTAAGDLHIGLMVARSEAIKHNASVYVVPVDGSNWALGWSIKGCGAGVQPCSLAAANQTFGKQDAYQNVAFRTATVANANINPLASVDYTGTGRLPPANAAGVMFVVSSPDYATIQARCVVIDPAGRPAVRQDGDYNAANGCN